MLLGEIYEEYDEKCGLELRQKRLPKSHTGTLRIRQESEKHEKAGKEKEGSD